MWLLDFLLGKSETQLIFALQLLSAAALYGFQLPRRDKFPQRLAVGLVIYVLFAELIPDPMFQGVFFLPPLAVFSLLLLLAHLIFDISWKSTLFYGVAAYATQHMAVTLNDAIHSAIPTDPGGPWWGGTCWISFLLVFLLCWQLFARRMKGLTTEHMQSGKLVGAALIIFAFVYVLRILCVEQLDALPVGSFLRIAGHLYSMVGCFASLWVLFSTNHEDSLEAENRIIERLLREREAQQRFTSETIELVNIKCHDMKRQVALLRSDLTGQERAGALNDMERAATLYDSISRTGNPAMDTILTEKGLYCERHQISLDCMVDGEQLSFLPPADLCAMFGNILENAIEAVQESPEDRRMISLQVFSKRGYLCVHAENYCAEPPHIKDGLPVTTKLDKNYHGFGMKSIRYIVRKYDGNMTVSTPPDMFCLDILIPIPEGGR